jgi:glycerol-3-phosphate dehydrogenase (NAD(P)+)
MNFNIIGAGTWGITFANLLSFNGYNVKVLHRNSLKTLNLIKYNEHPDLSGYKISKRIQYTDNFQDLNSNTTTILAIPSDSISQFVSTNNLSDFKIVLLTKGFDCKSGMLISELLINNYNYNINNIAILSGPNHAEEIIKKNPTASIIASTSRLLRDDLQNNFSNNFFRLYTTDDIIGVQLGGAIKNVIAIASGICKGLNLGDNAQAALVTRGLHEIMQLSNLYDFKSSTIYGLSGLGDLVCTCYSPYSRNRRLGELLSKGISLEESKKSIGMISEGINTSRILNTITEDNDLHMPICKEVYNIIFKKSNPRISILSLMNRPLKDEK